MEMHTTDVLELNCHDKLNPQFLQILLNRAKKTYDASSVLQECL